MKLDYRYQAIAYSWGQRSVASELSLQIKPMLPHHLGERFHVVQLSSSAGHETQSTKDSHVLLSSGQLLHCSTSALHMHACKHSHC